MSLTLIILANLIMLQGCLPMSLANDHELERVAYLQADKHKGLNISLNAGNKLGVVYAL